VIILPITVRLIAYGPAANISAIRTRAAALLEDEHGASDERSFAPLASAEAHAEITAKRWDTEVPLKKPPPSQAGLLVTLVDVHERATTDWLDELPVAKTCVAFATWISAREPVSWQLLIAQGRRWSENRPQSR
jgi:hypothetical protein